MREKQLRVEYTAVQVNAPTEGNSAAGALLWVEGGKPQVEIVIESADPMVGNPKLAEALLGEFRLRERSLE